MQNGEIMRFNHTYFTFRKFLNKKEKLGETNKK